MGEMKKLWAQERERVFEETGFWPEELEAMAEDAAALEALQEEEFGETYAERKAPKWPDDFRGFGSNVKPRRSR